MVLVVAMNSTAQSYCSTNESSKTEGSKSQHDLSLTNSKNWSSVIHLDPFSIGPQNLDLPEELIQWNLMVVLDQLPFPSY